MQTDFQTDLIMLAFNLEVLEEQQLKEELQLNLSLGM